VVRAALISSASEGFANGHLTSHASRATSPAAHLTMSRSASILIATRGSALALAQANLVLALCREAWPGQPFDLNVIKTTGDKLQTAALAAGDLPKGLFTKEIEEALLRREADLAVHSLKDLPTELPAGLKLGAVTSRADVRDVLLYRDLEYLVAHVDPTQPTQQNRRGYKPALTLRALPVGATVATSSTRRSAQALEHRPDLKIVPIRGNVGTRLKKLAEQSELDATILAAAGLERLQFRITPAGQLEGGDVPPGLAATRLSLGEMLPCVGQAAIGLEIREGDARLETIVAQLNHAETFTCVTAERAFLSAMGGGCHLAVAAHAQLAGSELVMRGVSFLSGQPRRGEERGPLDAPEALGQRLAARLRA
jgi:porphobilinogen deaminase